MRLTKQVSLVASGKNGLHLTHGLDCNVYLVDCTDGLLMIDAGAGVDNEAILREIRNDGYDPKNIRWILITHAHADHAAGAAFFKDYCGASIYADGHEAQMLKEQKMLDESLQAYIDAGFYPEGYEFPGVACDYLVKDGEELIFGSQTFQTLVTPGHTGGGICLFTHMEGRKVLFCGDLVFWNGLINLISIFDSNLLAYKESVIRLARLKIDTLFAGHLQPVMQEAWIDIDAAADCFNNFSVPESLC